MTSGTKTVDLRTTISLGCGPTKVGQYYQKIWNGTNRSGNPATWFSEEHPYSMTYVKEHATSGTVRQKSGFQFTGTIPSCFGGVAGASKWSANDDLALIGKLREKVAGSGFNAAVSLAEGRKSLDMIFESANRIGSALRDIRKGNALGAYEALTGRLKNGRPSRKWGQSERILNREVPKYRDPVDKNVSSNWLQLQYGWLPLINDAEEGAKFLAQQSLPRTYKVRVRRRIVTPNKGASPTNTQFSGQMAESGQLVAILREINVAALSGLLNPAAVAWELVPYSFVADWFIPIGSYLDARGLAQSLTGTFVTTRVNRQRAEFIGFQPASVYASFTGTYSYESMSLTRTVSSSLAIPLPEVKPLNKVFSWKRAANAVALLVQATR